MNKKVEYDTKFIRDEPGEKTIDIPKERLDLLHFVFSQDNWRPWLKVKIEDIGLEGITHLFINLNEVDEIEERKFGSKKSLREVALDIREKLLKGREDVCEKIIEEMEKSRKH